VFDKLFQTLNHLPVMAIAPSVADHFVNQLIPVVTSEVASGKTMLVPAHCAALLADDPVDKVVYVLEPTRFLANNAAESLRSILGPEGETLIGCINSSRSDDDSIKHANNRVIFTTVGYALSSGILKTKSNFIIDEAHETSISLSLAKSYLKHRRNQGDIINFAIMSATIDVTNELEYWGDDAIQFETSGSAFPVEFKHMPAATLAEAALELVRDHGRTGILVFVSGVEEIEEAVSAISLSFGIHGIDFEIDGIHGNSTQDVRKRVSRPRQKAVKIAVGTNVLESGVSLPWVNAGISSGDTKIMHAKGNVRKLTKEELPRWRVEQQMGRVARFEPGVFVLAHRTPLQARPDMSAPDIVRLPLTELVMQCTNFPDIHIHDLEFTKRESPKPEDVTHAIKTLVDYGLIEELSDGQIVLTTDGKMIQPLPLSYQAAAAYCEAVRIDKVAQFLPFIAMMDIGDMRHVFKYPMQGGVAGESDVFFQLQVLTRYFSDWKSLKYRQLIDLCEMYNVSQKKLKEFDLLLSDLEKKLEVRSDFTPYEMDLTGTIDKEFHRCMKQVSFRALTSDSYPYSHIGRTVKIPVTAVSGGIFGSASISNSTTVSISYDDDVPLCGGNVRVITPKSGRPFAVLEMVTLFTKEDLKHLIKRFGRGNLERIAALSIIPSNLSRWLGGDRDAYTSLDPSPSSYLLDAYRTRLPVMPTADRVRGFAMRAREEEKPEPIVTAAAARTGTLGDILSAALKKK
jgi:HrpA-like RNA helicase